MCCDYAVHDEGDGNPHAHVLLTMRGLDEQGKWLPKSKSEFVLDENGQRIRQKNRRWKCRKVNTVDWNDQNYCEVWRHEWELLQNQFLQQAGRTERVDMRSFERQRSDFAPTVHMGAAITNMERKGISTDIRVQCAVETLKKNGVVEIEDFRAFLTRLSQDTMNLRHNYNIRIKKSNRLNRVIAYCENKELYDTVYRKYQNIHFKGAREKYYQEHKTSIDCCIQAQKAMKEYRIFDAASARYEQGRLKQENAVNEDKLHRVNDMLIERKAILKMANAALPSDMEKITYVSGDKQTGKELLPEPNFPERQRASIQRKIRDNQKKEGQPVNEQRTMEAHRKQTYDQTL